MNKSKGQTITTIILLLICIVLTGSIVYKLFNSSEEKIPLQMQQTASSAVNVYTEEMQKGEFLKTIRVYGTVTNEADDINIISSTSGYVTELLVKEGDDVKAGDIIAYVDASTPGSSYKQAVITSKASGKIGSISTSAGNYITQNATIASVEPETILRIEADIPEIYLSSIKIGSEATVTSSLIKEMNINATVSEISSSIDTSSRTFEITLSADDLSLLKEGMVVTMDLVTESYQDVLSIPLGSVSILSGKTYVYTVEDGKAVQKEVTLSSDNGERYLLVSGLDEGSIVITEGTVSEGSTVNILER